MCPNASVYNMLIKGFRKVGNAREGIRVLKGMLDDECLLNKSTYSILIEGLYESGLEEKTYKHSFDGEFRRRIDPDSWDVFLNIHGIMVYNLHSMN